jgi:hypothetical protein
MRPRGRLVLALSIAALGLALIGYALDRREKHAASPLLHTASSEKTGDSAVFPDAPEWASQSSREQDATERAPQSERELDSGESYLRVRQPTQERTRADLTRSLPAEVVAAQAGQATDVGAIGQPFPVSESVVEACKPVPPGVFRRSACDRVNDLRIEIANEPRDEIWAAAAERALRAYAEEEPEKFTIRALECRRTICFIETASIYGGLPDPGYHFLRNHGLKRERPVDAHENDETGARLTITLLPVTRR